MLLLTKVNNRNDTYQNFNRKGIKRFNKLVNAVMVNMNSTKSKERALKSNDAKIRGKSKGNEVPIASAKCMGRHYAIYDICSNHDSSLCGVTPYRYYFPTLADK